MRLPYAAAVVLQTSLLLLTIAPSYSLAESTARPDMVARTTDIPACTTFVDAAAKARGNGSREAPHKTITAAVAAIGSGAVICVAQGLYAEQIEAGEKAFTLAGGFQSGTSFEVRDSAAFISKAQGKGKGSFLRIAGDTAPQGDDLTAVDGFEITGYSQAIVRDFWEPQRFDITNNYIHDNTCDSNELTGAAFALVNTSGTIKGNVIRKNACGRGGGGTLIDNLSKGVVTVANNHVDGNSGTEPNSAHGGGFYFFVNKLTVSGNLFTANTVTQWGGGLFIGAYTPGGQFTNATMRGNVYRGNKAGNSGGGFFCDDGATCLSEHEVYAGNCGGNILVDGGSGGSEPTRARFTHITSIGALTPECDAPGIGFLVSTSEALAPDTYEISNALFWDNADAEDVVGNCDTSCGKLKVTVAKSMLKVNPDQSIKIKYLDIMPPADPMFVAPEAGDYRLRPESPALGKGSRGANLGATVAGSALSAPTGRGKALPPASPASAPAAAVPHTTGVAPAVKRGEKFFGFPEKFNRYYTDPSWKPALTIFASANGRGDGSTRAKPASLPDAIAEAKPGMLIFILRGRYQGGLEFSEDMSGTYDAPIVLYGERNEDGSLGVIVDCAVGARKTCLNFEGASYIAADGLQLEGGAYGMRAVGLGFAASEHARGIAMLNSFGDGQDRDPFKTAQSDWTVIERNLGINAKTGDGHGIYVSGGSDWGIVRANRTYSNASSDLQINADPASNCEEVGIAYDDPRCDAFAGDGEGGQGASDYFLVEGNYCHRSAVGPNFTSVRRSVIRNNVFGPQTRHNTSFWQQTDNPKLGSSENKILHNLFITTQRHAIKFENHSGRNTFANNIVLGVKIDGKAVSANATALLMETDESSSTNISSGNFYTSGRFEGRGPGSNETVMRTFDTTWFAEFPTGIEDNVAGFRPTSAAPFLDRAKARPDVPADMLGSTRSTPSDVGPLEGP